MPQSHEASALPCHIAAVQHAACAYAINWGSARPCSAKVFEAVTMMPKPNYLPELITRLSGLPLRLHQLGVPTAAG